MRPAEPDWRSLHDGLRRFVFSRVSNQALAHDLLQETLLRLHERRDPIEQERVMAYARRVANSVIVDHFRSARPEVSYQDDLEGRSTTDANEESELPRHILGQWLASQIDGLPARYRDVLRLVEVEGRSQREVAIALDLPYSTVKSRVQRGRDLLHANLSACCAVERDGRGRVTNFERRADGGCATDCTPHCDDVCKPS